MSISAIYRKSLINLVMIDYFHHQRCCVFAAAVVIVHHEGFQRQGKNNFYHFNGLG